MPGPIGTKHTSSPPPPDDPKHGSLGGRRVEHSHCSGSKNEGGILGVLQHAIDLHVRHMEKMHHTFGPDHILREVFHALDHLFSHAKPSRQDIENLAKKFGIPPTELLQKYTQHLLGKGDFQGALKVMQLLIDQFHVPAKDMADLIKIFEALSHLLFPLADFSKDCMEAVFVYLFSQNQEMLADLSPKLQAHLEKNLEPHLFNPNQNPDTSQIQQMIEALAKFDKPAANQLVLKATLFHLMQGNLKNMHQALSFLANNYTPTSAQTLKNDLAQIIRMILVNDKQPPLALMEALGYLKKINDKGNEFQDEFIKKEENAGLRWILAHVIRAIDHWCHQTEKRKLHELQQIVAALIYFAHQGEPAAQHRLVKLVDWLAESTITAERKYGKELSKEISSFKSIEKKK